MPQSFSQACDDRVLVVASLHQLYRTMAYLGEELGKDEQAGASLYASPCSPRCVKDEVEEALFARRQDLFSGLDLVFFDTTSIYFEGEGGATLGQHGHNNSYSKDHRPDRKQMVVGMILDGHGRPVCSEMWPGNTADVTTLLPIVDRLKRRFSPYWRQHHGAVRCQCRDA